MEGRPNLIRIISEEEYHVQEWYPWIADLTFQTIFLPLTVAEAKAIIRHTKLSVKDETCKYGKRFICDEKTESIIRNDISKIEFKIDQEIQCIGGTETGVFVRLSSRSPKDSVQQNLYDIYLKEKKLLLEEGYSDNPVSSKIAFTRANVRCLRVYSASEALQLFLNSNRVHEDLQMMLKLTTLSDNDVITQVVVRKWEPILPEFEFRGFVFNRKLTAFTQYYKSTFVPRMCEMASELESRIFQFFENTQNFIPERVLDYVVDYAIDPHSDKIWIVEINTPPPVAGQALFDWENKEDHEILTGQKPFEFRILLTPPLNPMQDVQQFIADGEKNSKNATKRNNLQRKQRL